ncbi:MAG TPA: di-heme oxidoredictase family protein [Steroidobacteraceae bacterium]
MEIRIWIALFSVALYTIACSTVPDAASSPRAPPGASTGHSKLALHLPQAPTGFDNYSNGVADESTHQWDQAKFEQVEAVSDGLGPLFNAQSCGECHQSPVTGGASQVMELRVGHTGSDGKFQNAEIPINRGSEIIKGRTLVNMRAICPNAAFPTTEIQERVPVAETIRTFRTSLSILGDGFVEAVDDSTLIDIAKMQCKQDGGKICGLVLYVPVLESPGVTRVGRFGWKNQHASLLSFSGDAYLNEVGITNSLFPDEVTKLCNTAAEPNDKPDAAGVADIDHFARFMRATKAPARDAQQAATAAAKRGEALFANIGCDICHVPSLATAAPGTLVNGGQFAIPEALGNKTFYPYGDFLLHDIGTGDGIVVAMDEHYGKRMYQTQWKNLSLEAHRSCANKMRTAPLWGVRLQPMLMHDGASLTFRDAIVRHRGEASHVTERFEKLSQTDQETIVEFLKSL